MAFDDPTFDESRRAQLVAKRIGCDHHIEVCRGKDMLDLTPAIIATMDEPLADASILPTFLLARSTARSVKVALSGDGGDELFAGYPTFQALRYRRGVRMLPEFARRAMASAVRRLPVSQDYMSLDFKLRQFMRGIEGPSDHAFFYWMGAFTETDKQALLAHTGSDVFEDMAETSAFDDDVQKCLYLCAKHYLQDGVLVKMDRASMANSLEVRAPFLDPDVVEFSAECPLEYKMTLTQTKWIVRHAARGILPGEVLWGKKRGFGPPVGKWIKGELKDLFCDTLDEKRIRREGLFNPAEVHRLLAAHLAGAENNWRLLWTLLVFELWRERMQSV
jgi:asparagine synthase (glutamine-hydrolysing)